MTLRYRTTGTWGAGLGVNLTAAQVDENFYTLKQEIDTVAASGVEGVGVTNATLVGTQLTFYLSDASTLGPFTLQTPRVPTVQTVSASTYTLAAADISKYLRATNVSGLTVTVPLNDTVEIPVDSEFHFRQAEGCPSITFIEATTGVVIYGIANYSLGTDTEGATCTLKKIGEDTWDLFGLLASGTY